MSSQSLSEDQEAELASVKLTRAISDPIIVHGTTDTLPFGSDHEIYQHIKEARLAQLRHTPMSDRIERATVPEVLVYLYTASFDEKNMNQEFNRLYQYALSKYTERWSPNEVRRFENDIENCELDTDQLGKFESLQEKIKLDRDHHFVTNDYARLGLNSTPRTFWVQNPRKGGGIDEESRKLLEDIED